VKCRGVSDGSFNPVFDTSARAPRAPTTSRPKWPRPRRKPPQLWGASCRR